MKKIIEAYKITDNKNPITNKISLTTKLIANSVMEKVLKYLKDNYTNNGTIEPEYLKTILNSMWQTHRIEYREGFTQK